MELNSAAKSTIRTEKKERGRAQAGISVKKMTICAMCIALTYVATAFINVRLPIAANGGLIHLGNAALFICAILFGKKIGAIAGGLGMAIFDLMGGWVSWAPFTLVIVGLMGFIVGFIGERKSKFGWYIVSILFALLIKIGGYYIAEGILYGNWVAPLTSIPGNIVQVILGAVIALPVAMPLRKIVKKMGI